MSHSVITANKKFYPQTLLVECKYIIKKNNIENLMNDDLDLSASDEFDNLITILVIDLIMDLMLNFLEVKTVFNNNESLIMHGQNRAWHYLVFLNINFTIYSTDRNTNKKYLHGSNFEMHFLKEQY